MKDDMTKKLIYMEFLQRESMKVHHRYSDEMQTYEYIKLGDKRAIKENDDLFNSDLVGHLSDDPLRNKKYLFICCMTIVTRFVIEGGMEPEIAYNTSDLYIQSVDKLRTIEEVKNLHHEMVEHFTNEMAKIRKKNIFSKPISEAVDYIYNHLHEIITVKDIADEIELNSSYLSTLFKKEVGIDISIYIRNKRMEAAENMIKFSNFSLSEISEFLAFSSYSHFSSVFKKHTGYTPKKYQDIYYREAINPCKTK